MMDSQSPASGTVNVGHAPNIETCRQTHERLQYEVSRYIELLLAELGTMARAAELQHLLYFLEMTREAAADQTRRSQSDR